VKVTASAGAGAGQGQEKVGRDWVVVVVVVVAQVVAEGGFVALGPYTQGMSDKPPIRWSEMHTHPLAISPVHRSIECYDEAFRPGVQFS